MSQASADFVVDLRTDVEADRPRPWPSLRSVEKLLFVGGGTFAAALFLSWVVQPSLDDQRTLSVLWALLAFYVRTFQFHAGVLLIVAALFLCARRRFYTASTLFALALTAVGPEVARAWPKPSAVAGADDLKLRVMSVNQLRANVDTAATQAVIRNADPDVILIQEFTQEHGRQLAHALSRYPHRALYPSFDYQGLAVYSRLPLRVIAPPQPGTVRSRYMQVAVQVAAREIRLFNVHPTSPGPPWRIARNRLETATLLGDVGDARAMPTLVVGDFNFVPHSQQARAMNANGLRHVDDLAGAGFRWTWGPGRGRPPLVRIDHVFVSSHFAVSSSSVGGSVGSDHRPIIVDLVLRAAARGGSARQACVRRRAPVEHHARSLTAVARVPAGDAGSRAIESSR